MAPAEMAVAVKGGASQRALSPEVLTGDLVVEGKASPPSPAPRHVAPSAGGCEAQCPAGFGLQSVRHPLETPGSPSSR